MGHKYLIVKSIAVDLECKFMIHLNLSAVISSLCTQKIKLETALKNWTHNFIALLSESNDVLRRICISLDTN
jgi:hypothetical protein